MLFRSFASLVRRGGLMLALLGSVFQATGASGTISGAVTWRAVDSPISVTASVTIASGATLTIEPGVTVAMASGADFTIANGGRVLAEGTAAAPIKFTRPANTTVRWGGIIVNGGAGSLESRFVYCRIEFNNSTAIHSSGGTVLLDHLTFGSTDKQYVSLDGSSFVVSNCIFPNTTAAFEGVHGTGGIKSGGRGIIRDSYFGVTSGYNDIIDFTGGNRPGPVIHFLNNVFTGATDDILDLDGTDAWVEGNIFMHSHKNGSPDSSSAVSGGADSGNTSQVTIIRNLFYDCDQVATAKEGNFFSLINNTIVHITKTGGVDTASGVVNVRDLDPSPTVIGAGFYLEGNIVADIEQLVRNYDANQTTVTWSNNIIPIAWTGPGGGNSITNPMLKHIPQLSETVFSDWASAQVMWDWLSLQPGSPAIATGPNGEDKGGAIPGGVSISGEPSGTTAQRDARLTLGVNRTGSGIPTAGWPNGAGYTAYQWRLDGGAWSAETAINTPILLSNLSDGPHYVEAIGKLDSGLYRNNAEFGTNAVVSRTATWTAGQQNVQITSVTKTASEIRFQFTAAPASGFTVQYKNDLNSASWSSLLSGTIPAGNTNATVNVTDALGASRARFYRISVP